MRDKELGDRYTREHQEQAWISVMHGQPAQIEPTTGMIPLAPLVDTTASPLVAARAAAASLSWSTNNHAYPNATLPASPWTSGASQLPRLHQSAMVKLGKPQPSSFERPTSMQFPFASTLAKPKTTTNANATPSTLLELLPKRKRDDVEEDHFDDDVGPSNGAKRACLPKKCDFPMCKNSSRSRGFCYSHGGGRRCRVEGCTNGAVSRDLCKRHGGGRRCRIPGCKSSSESGGLCYSHGGGRRCSLSWCNARAKKGGYCAVHLEHQDATPPPENENETPSSPSPAVSSQVVETLLALSKSPKDDEHSSTSRNPFALASILN